MDKMDSSKRCDHKKVYSAVIHRAWICKFCGHEDSDSVEIFSKEPNEYDTLKRKKAVGEFDKRR
jgi:hypothetical protein